MGFMTILMRDGIYIRVVARTGPAAHGFLLPLSTAWIVVPCGRRGKSRLWRDQWASQANTDTEEDLPQTSKLRAREMKNQGSHIAETPLEISGDIGPGPILLGAKARAQMVATEPNT